MPLTRIYPCKSRRDFTGHTSIQTEGERGRHSVSIHDIYDTTDGPTATELARTALVAIETLNVNSVPEPKVPTPPRKQCAILFLLHP